MGVEGRRNGYHHPRLIDYKEITGITPDLIYVTSGGVTITQPSTTETPRVSTTNFYDEDPRGLLSWGRSRVDAAAILGYWFPDAGIVTMTTSSNTPDGHTDAGVAAYELRQLGVRNPITVLSRSIDTHTEMLLAAQHAIETSNPHMLIVVGGFQEDRVRAMLDSILHASTDGDATIRRVIQSYRDRYPHRARDIDYYEQVFAHLRANTDRLSRLRPEFTQADSILQYDPQHRAQATEAIIHPRYINKTVQDSVGANEWRNNVYCHPELSSMVKGR